MHTGDPGNLSKPRNRRHRQARPPAAKGVRTVEIVGTEDMKFSMATITAKPGEQLRIRLVVKGAMPKIAMAHNFVLLNKSAKVVDFATAAMNARATDFIPAEKKADIIAHTDPGRRRRDGRSHLQGAGRRGRVSVPVLVPRPLPGRDEGNADRQVGSSRVQGVQGFRGSGFRGFSR